MRAVHVLAICAAATFGTTASAQEIDWKKVDEALGRSPAAVAGDVHRYGFPRTDLQCDARRRHHPAGICARGLGGVQAGTWRGDGDG